MQGKDLAEKVLVRQRKASTIPSRKSSLGGEKTIYRSGGKKNVYYYVGKRYSMIGTLGSRP